MDYTIDELIETINRSSLLTLVVEGTTDELYINRFIEKIVKDKFPGLKNVDFVIVEGKKNLLDIFDKNDRITKPVLFMCDRDFWIYTNTPKKYISNQLVITKGYNIENDIYTDGIAFIRNTFDNVELNKFNSIIENVCSLYSFFIKEYIDGYEETRTSTINVLNKSEFDYRTNNFTNDFISKYLINLDENLKNDIIDDYALKLNGKIIFDCIHLILSKRTNSKRRLGRNQVLDTAISHIITNFNKNSILNKHITKISKGFEKYSTK